MPKINITLRPAPHIPTMPPGTSPEMKQALQNNQQWSRDAEQSIRAIQKTFNDALGKTINVAVTVPVSAFAPTGNATLQFFDGILVDVKFS